MLVRALIVLLFALNIGVAAWWIARPAPAVARAPALPPGVARLQLADEGAAKRAAPVAAAKSAPVAAVPAALLDKAGPGKPEAVKSEPTKPATEAAKPTPAPASTLAATAPAPVAPVPPAEPAKAQCFSIGPFADIAAAEAARAKLRPLAQTLATRNEGGGGKSSRGWRVYLPAANAEAAQASAQRIRAAGFNDLFVMSGADANAVALGRFRSEESARRRGNELSAAGFAVRVESLDEDRGGGAAWIDVATTTSTGEALRRAAGASRWRGRTCAGLG